MKRNHIRNFSLSYLEKDMAIGYPKENEVISGMRKSCDLFIEIDVAKAMKNGMIFYESKNKVVLSSGFDGIIPRVFLKELKYRNILKEL